MKEIKWKKEAQHTVLKCLTSHHVAGCPFDVFVEGNEDKLVLAVLPQVQQRVCLSQAATHTDQRVVGTVAVVQWTKLDKVPANVLVVP